MSVLDKELTIPCRYSNAYKNIIFFVKEKQKGLCLFEKYLTRVIGVTGFDFVVRYTDLTNFIDINMSVLDTVENLSMTQNKNDNIQHKIFLKLQKTITSKQQLVELQLPENNKLLFSHTPINNNAYFVEQGLTCLTKSVICKCINMWLVKIKTIADKVIGYFRNYPNSFSSDFTERFMLSLITYAKNTWNTLLTTFLIPVVETKLDNTDMQSLFDDAFNVLPLDQKIHEDLADTGDDVPDTSGEFDKRLEPEFGNTYV